MASKLSRGQIRKRCGLQLKVAYSYHHSKELWLLFGNRRSGRTTDMVVEILHYLQNEPRCVIVAHTMGHACRIAMQVKEYAEVLGLDSSRVHPRSHDTVSKWSIRGYDGKVFYDHYYPAAVMEWVHWL